MPVSLDLASALGRADALGRAGEAGAGKFPLITQAIYVDREKSYKQHGEHQKNIAGQFLPPSMNGIERRNGSARLFNSCVFQI